MKVNIIIGKNNEIYAIYASALVYSNLAFKNL